MKCSCGSNWECVCPTCHQYAPLHENFNATNMSEKMSEMKLSEHQIDFIKYFINKYHRNFNSGNIQNAHHDATAVVLLLDEILNHGARSAPIQETPE